MLEEFRMFGLNHCELPIIISNIAFLLRLIILKIDNRNTEKISTISYIVTILSGIGYFYTYFLSVIWYVFWRCRETGDKIAAIIVFSLGAASEIAFYKYIFMIIYRNSVKDIVDGYLALDALILPGSRLSRNMHSKLRIIKKRAFIYWIFIVSNGILYILKPIIQPGRHLMEDHFDLIGLDPILESPNYEIAFTATVLGVFFTSYLSSTISAFLIVVTGFAESHLLAVSEEITNLWEDANAEIETASDVHLPADQIVFLNINNRLREVIKTHITIINITKQIEKVFSGAILIEFILVITSLIAELLGGLENTYLEMPFALFQLSMDCITGQKLIDACDVFSRAVYDSKWEKFDVKNGKMVLLMLQNSQKTLSLSAGGMTTLSFVCLMSMLKMIYSTYTTLRSTV
ncbi:unnamed protein product [Pieris macdunnoughi]|uniref:Odorant receptor n=1 Tax=Pieris macdunnoughi TaxID=345717 RepID=A0A821WNP6_9NEOP|nr:unnamed protein product [Pieris macdunnoughi]